MLDVLRQLGFDARLRVLSGNLQFTYIQNTANHVQISLTPWYADYPGATDFLPRCSAARHTIRAPTARSTSPGCATRRWTRACRRWPIAATRRAGPRSTARSPTGAGFAVLFNPRYIDVTSRRVEGFSYHEQYHWLLAQSRLR